MLTPLTHDDPYEFGTYRLLARMGGGGMGTVYLARSPGGRTVALKTMHARIAADPASRTRFRLETDAARVIGGRYGAQVVDADVASATPWFATEYVLGPPLGHVVGLAGPLPETTVRALGAALCQALGQLHRSDVVHRDLKPSNLLITAYGPKVIDFGIARALGDDRLTSTGNTAGTPAFMSPEQASGQEHTAAGDVFALAGVLVFAASGHGPFGDGQPADLLYRVKFAEADLTGVPAALVPLLSRCLDKDPDRRPGTEELAAGLHDGGGEFADHLPPTLLAEIGRIATEVWQPAPARLPAPAYPSPETEPPEAERRKPSRRVLLAAGGGAVLAVASGAGAWALLGPEETKQGGGSAAPYRKPSAGPSVKPLKKKKLDSDWQIQVAGPPDDVTAALPLAVRDLVVVVAGQGLGGITADGGTVRFTSDRMERTWQLGTDGRTLYRIVDPPGSEGHKGDSGFPLLVASVDLATGEARKPFAKLPEFNGVLYESQLVCAADGVVYVVAGTGKYSMDGFLGSQSWSLVAIDASSGKKKWSQALPGRRDDSERLHFLDAAVSGGHLVAFQEMTDGEVRVVARDVRDGRTVWQRRAIAAGTGGGGGRSTGTDPDGLWGRLTLDGKHVYLGGDRLRALRLTDGKQAWSARPSTSGRTFGPPSVKSGVVYAVEEKLGLVAYSTGGSVEWRERGGYGTTSKLTERPAVGAKFAYCVDDKGLRAVGLGTRAADHRYKTTGTRFVAHEHGKVVIALGGHFLAAFPLR